MIRVPQTFQKLFLFLYNKTYCDYLWITCQTQFWVSHSLLLQYHLLIPFQIITVANIYYACSHTWQISFEVPCMYYPTNPRSHLWERFASLLLNLIWRIRRWDAESALARDPQLMSIKVGKELITRTENYYRTIDASSQQCFYCDGLASETWFYLPLFLHSSCFSQPKSPFLFSKLWSFSTEQFQIHLIPTSPQWMPTAFPFKWINF